MLEWMVRNTLQTGGELVDTQSLKKQVMRWDDKQLSGEPNAGGADNDNKLRKA